MRKPSRKHFNGKTTGKSPSLVHARKLRKQSENRVMDLSPGQLAEIKKAIQEAEEHEDNNFRKFRKELRRRTKIIGAIFLPVTLIFLGSVEYFTGVMLDSQNADKVLDKFGLVESTKKGRVIHSGAGKTPYTGFSNTVANSLNDLFQISGYGFEDPSKGSLENIATLIEDRQGAELSIAQGDAAIYAANVLGMDHFTVLRELDSAPEIAFTISSSFANYAEMKAAIDEAAQTATRTDDVRIGLPSFYTGSFITTMALMEPMDGNGYRFISCDDSDAMLSGIQGDTLDMACIVQYPGFVDFELVGGLKTIIDSNIQIMAMDEESFSAYFQDHAYGYRYIEATISPDFALMRKSSWDSIAEYGTMEFPPLLATNPVYVAKNTDQIENPRDRHFAGKVHTAIKEMPQSNMIPSNLPQILELSPESDTATDGLSGVFETSMVAPDWAVNLINFPDPETQPETPEYRP